MGLGEAPKGAAQVPEPLLDVDRLLGLGRGRDQVQAVAAALPVVARERDLSARLRRRYASMQAFLAIS